jgi:hypothetical protein
VRVPINTFQRSNPNRISTEAVNPTDLTTVSTPQTIRPIVPEELETIIEEETKTESATPEKSKTLFEKFLEKMANPQ